MREGEREERIKLRDAAGGREKKKKKERRKRKKEESQFKSSFFPS